MGLMLQLFASVLLTAQLASFAGPVVLSQPVGLGGAACEQTAVLVTLASVGGTADCQGCNIPDCDSMLSCAGVTTALTHDVAVTFVLMLARASGLEPAAAKAGAALAPTLPPPRA